MSIEELNIFKSEGIIKLLALVISDFQELTSEGVSYKIAIFSRKGTLYEQRFSELLSKSIEIVPYHKLKETDMDADLLVVDDLRLLKNAKRFNHY
ncbi:hypothetical protein, partial [Enterococcus faecium]|uniref:hypothetical protein n=1 Tax=Enterococcus faecium TaxID=1352 RepID=UPI0023B23F48